VKLEELLESKLRESGSSSSAKLEDEIAELRRVNEALENGAREDPTFDASPGACEKCQALEEQLVSNAKSFARELSAVQMKLFEAEAELLAGSASESESESESGLDNSSSSEG